MWLASGAIHWLPVTSCQQYISINAVNTTMVWYPLHSPLVEESFRTEAFTLPTVPISHFIICKRYMYTWLEMLYCTSDNIVWIVIVFLILTKHTSEKM